MVDTVIDREGNASLANESTNRRSGENGAKTYTKEALADRPGLTPSSAVLARQFLAIRESTRELAVVAPGWRGAIHFLRMSCAFRPTWHAVSISARPR